MCSIRPSFSRLLTITIIVVTCVIIPFSSRGESAGIVTIPPNAQEIEKKQIDVTGDQVPDTVTLLGVKEENTIYHKAVFVKVENPVSQITSVIPIEGGYYPQIHFCDFSGSGIPGIMVNVDTGGSGGIVNTYLYTVQSDIVKPITLPNPLDVKVTYKDNYLIQFSIVGQKNSYTFDFSDRKQIYEEVGVYKNGKIVNPPEVTVYPFMVLKFVDVDKDGVCELEGMQRITGVANADTLGIAISRWKFDKNSNQWILVKSTVEKA